MRLKKNNLAALKRVFDKMRIEFYEDLGEAMVDQNQQANSSWSIVGQIDTWRQRLAKRGDNRATVYAVILSKMRNHGATLPEALTGIASGMDVMALTAAEQEGDLGRGLVALAADVTEMKEMRSAVRAELIEPIVLAVILIAMLVGFSLGFMPILIEITPPEKLPTTTKILYYVAEGVTRFGLFFGAVGIAAVAWFIWSLDNFTGKFRDRIETWIGYSLYRDYNAALFLQALANLMHSNMTLHNSLTLLRGKASPWLRSHIIRITSRLDSGSLPQDAFTTGLLNINIEDRLRDYAQRSDFPNAIQKLGKNTATYTLKSMRASAGRMKNILKIIFVSAVLLVFIALIQSAANTSTAVKSNYTSSTR